MAGGGDYMRPSERLKKDFRAFYDGHRPTFEIAGILLVFSGLMLNIPAGTGILGQSVKFLQFFALGGSLVPLILILSNIAVVLLTPLLLWPDVSHNAKEFRVLMQSLSFATFLVMILLLFILSVFIYLLFAFNLELLTFALIALCYGLVYIAAPTKEPKSRHAAVAFTAVVASLTILVPLMLYVEAYSPGFIGTVILFLTTLNI